jgi:thiopeptide-type bacteriocin biosynthesis protein
MNARSALPAADWLYYRLYAGTPTDLQALLERVVRPLVRTAAGAGAGRWFFLRFLDGQGYHVRLRWYGDLETIAAIEQHARRALRSAYGSERDSWMTNPAQRLPEYHTAVYEPEYVKFGGEPGVELAECIFTVSSEAVLTGFDAAYWPRRVAYAAVHMALAVELLPPQQITAFLHQYEWYWCGQGRHPRHTAQVRSVAARILPDLESMARQLCSDRAAVGPLRHYVRTLHGALSGRDRPRIARSDAHLLFDHVHLTNNRLGVTPMEEAMLAHLLRTTTPLQRSVADLDGTEARS